MHASNGLARSLTLLPHLERAPHDLFNGDVDDDAGDDPLRTYLREIHEVNLLTAAE